MTDKEEEIFWDLVDKFIEYANEASQEKDLGMVNAALINASARFSAFYLAISAESKKDLQADSEDSIRYLVDEFKKQLVLNVDDYVENYKLFTKN